MRVKTSLTPPSSKPTLSALIRKASENTPTLKSDIKYQAVIQVEDARDPDTGIHFESSNARNYSTRDTSMPPSKSKSARKLSNSSFYTKSQLVPKFTTMIYGEEKPHKRSENAREKKTDLERKVTAPIQEARDPDSSVQSEQFFTDDCSNRDTSIPPSESLSVDNSDLVLMESFDLVADSSSFVDIESPLDLMGKFACTCVDVFFDYKCDESFHTLDMEENKEKSSHDESSSLGEMESSKSGSTDEIYWNYSGGLNRHEDKVSDLESLVTVLDTAEDEEKKSTSLDKMKNSDTGSTDETDRNYTGSLGRHDGKTRKNEISLGGWGSLGKVLTSIPTRSVTNENRTSDDSEPLTSRALADASMPREQSSVELARSKAVELSIPKTAAAVAEEKSRKRVSKRYEKDTRRTEAAARQRIAKRKRLSFRLKYFLSKGYNAQK